MQQLNMPLYARLCISACEKVCVQYTNHAQRTHLKGDEAASRGDEAFLNRKRDTLVKVDDVTPLAVRWNHACDRGEAVTAGKTGKKK